METNGARPMRGVSLSSPLRYNFRSGDLVKGDIWDAAWSAGGAVYAVVDDVQHWNGSLSANLTVASLEAAPPDLRATLVNPMPEFGAAVELGSDGACWKANGITCLGDTLYLSVSRHWYGHTRPDGRQVARDASVVISRDGGRSWGPLPPPHAEPFAAPLFPGPNFATPFFAKYGRGGEAPSLDEADRYIYAISSDGYWDNGNAMHLGRVPRTAIDRLRLEDWEFFSGMRGSSPRWTRGAAGLDACAPIIDAPRRCGQAGAQFLPGFGRYLLVQWSYPDLGGPGGYDLRGPGFAVGHSIWEWYDAPHLWGPWTRFAVSDWADEGFYNPAVPAPYIAPDGRLWVLTTGDFRTSVEPPETSAYTLYLLEARLEA